MSLDRQTGHMPTPEALPSADAVARETKPDRDRAIDVARIVALTVVMFGHCIMLLATIDSTGVRVGNILAVLPEYAPLTWVLQVMPLFFLAGGAAGTYGWHPGTPWGRWLFTRAQRLYRPVFWYLAVWTVALIAVHATMGPESAEALGGECVALLWFLGVYLVALAFVPALTRIATGRWVAVLVASFIVLAAAFDALRFALDSSAAGTPNLIFVWLIPMVIGVAHVRHLIPRGVAIAVAAVALGAQVLLAASGIYDVTLVNTGAQRVSNVSPPTLVLALHCTWMSCVFVALAPTIQRWAQRPRIWYLVALGNRGAMTIYLWHIPVIAIAAFGLHAFGLDAFDPHAPGFWGLLALRVAVFAALMAVVFWLLTPLEHRPLPLWDRPVGASGARSVAAGVLACVAGGGLALMAKNGLYGVTGWSALGCFVVAAAAARLSAGTAPRQPN